MAKLPPQRCRQGATFVCVKGLVHQTGKTYPPALRDAGQEGRGVRHDRKVRAQQADDSGREPQANHITHGEHRQARPGSGLARAMRDELVAIDRYTIYPSDMNKRAMQESSFLILTALAAGSQHGYGIIRDVEGISGGRVRLQAGTLYTALERLSDEGLIEAEREEIVDSRLRRYYQITASGRQRLAEEAARLQADAAAALTRLHLAGGVAR